MLLLIMCGELNKLGVSEPFFTASSVKVFALLFSKSDRWSNTRVLVAIRRWRNCFGISFLRSFFLCAFCVKEKSVKQALITPFDGCLFLLSSPLGIGCALDRTNGEDCPQGLPRWTPFLLMPQAQKKRLGEKKTPLPWALPTPATFLKKGRSKT